MRFLELRGRTYLGFTCRLLPQTLLEALRANPLVLGCYCSWCQSLRVAASRFAYLWVTNLGRPLSTRSGDPPSSSTKWGAGEMSLRLVRLPTEHNLQHSDTSFLLITVIATLDSSHDLCVRLSVVTTRACRRLDLLKTLQACSWRAYGMSNDKVPRPQRHPPSSLTYFLDQRSLRMSTTDAVSDKSDPQKYLRLTKNIQ